MEHLQFLSTDDVHVLQKEFGTPLFVYDEAALHARAAELLAFDNPYGLTVRYAMKALPSAAVVKLLSNAGLHIDASSGFEAERAILAGVDPERIQITAQQLPDNLKALVEQGVRFNACSLHQLEQYCTLFPGAEVSVRINPGLGSGHNNRTNVGGPSSSFGIWHEHLDEVFSIATAHNVKITGMHTHIGSGGDPAVWVHCAKLSLDIAARMEEVRVLSLGGGFKTGRMPGEVSADLKLISEHVKPEIEAFAERTGRELHLEIEPGTYVVANAGAMVSSVMDVVDTGGEGNRFIKIDAGMTEVLRPSMYGAQHPITLVPADQASREEGSYLVVGHCCESGDILTPEPGNPEALAPRTLAEPRIGDALVIEGAGAYCASMAAKNYNSFPECAEVLKGVEGSFTLIRERQTLEQIIANERAAAD
jgi:diaminopimelate decarboxylase